MNTNDKIEIYELIAKDKVKEVDKLVQDGLDIIKLDYETQYGLIHIAIENDATNMVKYLVDKRVRLDIINEKSDTVMIAAVRTNNPKIISILTKVIDVNDKNIIGIAPLLYAAVEDAYVTIKPLMKAGADINTTNKQGHTSIMIAARLENMRTLKELLRYNPDLTLRTDKGEDVFDITNSAEVRKYLDKVKNIKKLGRFAKLMRD